ncbi:MAG: hypothetical protein AB7H97_14240, partial [Pseudobdellovibrionaceae bacterium]
GSLEAIAKNFLSLLIAALDFFAPSAYAVEIAIPDEELPSEAATAQLDSPRAVLHRKIKMINRMEAELRFGYLYDETFYQNQYMGLALGFNATDLSGYGFFFQQFAQGISDVGRALGKTKGQLDFSRAPGPEVGYGFFYQHRFMYGKISFSQETVVPMTIQTQFEVGQIKYGERSLPFLMLGVGPSIFMGTRWALSLQTRLIYRQAVNPISKSIRSEDPKPTSESDFKVQSRMGYDMVMGLKFLF